MGCGNSKVAQHGGQPAKQSRFKFIKKRKSTLIEPESFESEHPMTFSELFQKRQEFWHTNCDGVYGGKPEMWSALRAAAEAMLDGNVDAATAIVAASDLRLVGNSLANCYDYLGNEYQVPEYCFSRPRLLVEERETNTRTDSAIASVNAFKNPDAVVSIKIRLAPFGQDFMLIANKEENLLSIKRRLSSMLLTPVPDEDNPNPAPIDAPPARQRIFVHGKELDTASLIESLPEQCHGAADAKLERRNKAHPLQVFVLKKARSRK